VKKDTKEQPKKKGRGRPKGSKSGLPFTTFLDAISYSKNVWDKAQYKNMSFSEISEFMNLHPHKATRVLSVLRDYYGVVEQTEDKLWRLTDTGKRIAKNDVIAMKEVFSKNPMFSDLLNRYIDTDVTQGAILDYIKDNYKGCDAVEVRKRLNDGIEIIKKHSVKTSPEQSVKEVSPELAIPVFQLLYALKPPTDKEIENLVEKVAKVLSESNDDVLKLISDLMLEKKKDKKELLKLLDRAMKKLNLDTFEDRKESIENEPAGDESAEDETDENQAVD